MKKTIRITAWTVALLLTGVGVTALHGEDTTAPQAEDATTSMEAKDQNRPFHHRRHHRPDHRFAPPLIKALDTDGDGAISSSEIANASTSLATLDKNGDGNLTRDELRPKRWKRGCHKGGRKWNRPSDAGTPAETASENSPEASGETPAE